jgi:poly(glycerol-phosphate) alpha-glucosyltransferase
MSSVLALTDSLSRRGGGVSESLLGLFQALRDLGRTDLALAAGTDPDTARDLPRFAPLPSRTFPVHRLGPLALSPGLARHLRREAPGLIHLHGLWGPASRALAAARTGRSRWMVSPHGMVEPWAMRQGRRKRALAWQLWDGAVLRGAACLHALCHAELESCRALGLRQPVAVIPNGVTLPAPEPGEPGDAFLFLGRLHPKKGLDALIRAWALLPEPPPLRIAGWDDHPAATGWRRQVEEGGLAGTIRFVGEVAGTEKDRLFRAARAFILPSHSEGLPMAVLEAWSHRVPVLMTDACHLPEGFACGAARRIGTDPESIAAGVRDFLALDEPDRHAMGTAGRALVERAFTWPRIAARMAAVYDWVLGLGERPEDVFSLP